MNKRLLVASLMVLLLVAGGLVIQQYVMDDPLATVPAVGSASGSASASAAPPLRARARVIRANGTVERRSADGKWQPLAVGDELAIDDVVRTGAGGEAELDVDGNVIVTVSERTEVALAQVSKTLSRIQLADGRVGSLVKEGSGIRFRVEIRGSDAVAESKDGNFAVMRRGDGPIAVAARTGTVALSARGASVEVGEGELSLVERDQTPSKPGKISGSLFLKLGRPAGVVTTPETEIEGSTIPGAVVTINGKVATAGSDGRFARAVLLKEGSNEIIVEVEDVLGRRTRQTLAGVVRQSPAEGTSTAKPSLSGEVTW